MLTAAVLGLGVHALSASPASATLWTDWTSATSGAPGSAVGTLDGITVTYSGELISPPTTTDGSFAGWRPEGSFVGGAVTSSPATVGDIIRTGRQLHRNKHRHLLLAGCRPGNGDMESGIA